MVPSEGGRTVGLKDTPERDQRTLRSTAAFRTPKTVLRAALHLHGGRPTGMTRELRADRWNCYPKSTAVRQCSSHDVHDQADNSCRLADHPREVLYPTDLLGTFRRSGCTSSRGLRENDQSRSHAATTRRKRRRSSPISHSFSRRRSQSHKGCHARRNSPQDKDLALNGKTASVSRAGDFLQPLLMAAWVLPGAAMSS